MSLYKKIILLLFVTFSMNTMLEAMLKVNFGGVVGEVKRELLGPDVVSANDPRVIGIVIAGSFAVLCGGLAIYKVFSDNDAQAGWKNFIKKSLAFITGNAMMVGGIGSILFARTAVFTLEEITYQIVKEMNKEN